MLGNGVWLAALLALGVLEGAAAQTPPEGLVPPSPLEMPAPAWPAAVAAERGPATALLRVTIDAAGAVSRVEVRTSSGVEALDAAAAAAARRWRFAPARTAEGPLEVATDVPVTLAPPPAASAPAASTPATSTPAAPPPPAAAEAAVPPGPHDGAHGESPWQAPGEGAAAAGGEGGQPADEAPGRTTVVRGTAEPVVAGDFHIALGALAEVPRGSATDLLLLAPGVMLANHGGEGHADMVYLRGFDAGEGKDVEFSVQGVPLNDVSSAHGHGYADTYFLIPELVQGLRVTEGPYDPSQGDFAVAGSAEYQLGLSRRGLRVSAELGSFASRRLSAVWGPEGTPEATFVGLLVRQGEGFGPNRAFANAGVMGQTELALGESTRVRLFGAAYGARFATAGVVRETDVVASRLPCAGDADAQFFCTPDENQGGGVQRQLASLEVLTRLKAGGRLTTQAFFVSRQMRTRENFTGYLLDAPPEDGEQRGDNTEGAYGGQTLGLKGRFVPGVRWGEAGRPLELGYVARFDTVDTRMRRLRARGGAPYATLFDNAVRTTQLGAYATAAGSPLPRLTLRGGVRLDAFLFGVEDRARPAEDRQGARLPSEAVEAYGFALSPRLSADVALLPGLSWLTGAGLGARSSDAAALSDAELAPFARVGSAETGLRWVRQAAEASGLSLEARAGGFAARVDRDLLFDEEAGRNQPVGASHRAGVFGSLRVGAGRLLDVQGSASSTRAWQPEGGSPLSGPALPYVPQLLGRLDAVVRPPLPFLPPGATLSVALGATGIGPKPLPLGRSSEPIGLVDVALRGSWGGWEAGLAVENALDARWREAEFNYVSNFRGPDVPPSLLATRHFSAGAPRTLRLSLAAHFGL